MINKKMNNEKRNNARIANPRERQFCGNLNVITPQQVQWKPPLRQAAGTLAATRATVHPLTNE
jgi:hypothetical protein